MAIKSTEILSYKSDITKVKSHFALESIELDTHCTTNKNHRSEDYKVFIIMEGSGVYQVDFKKFSIENSGIFCLSPDQVLSVESESLKSAYQISFDKDFYCVETHGKEIACNGVLFNNVHRATCIPLDQKDLPTFQLLIDNIKRELQEPGKAHQEMLETYLRMLLLEVLRRYDTLNSQTVQEVPNILVGDFIALVDKHFKQIHKVSEYAQMLYVTPKSLSKRLNALGYKTPTELIRDRIILEAKRDLKFTSKSVKEIALELGFDDPGYFTRFFKKSEGISPLIYKDSK